MKINTICTQFCGIKSPYRKNGYLIKPISVDPTDEQIKGAEESTVGKAYLGKGLNGVAYPYSYAGRDLVVKKYYPQSESYASNAPESEFEKLDMLYERNVQSEGIQQGRFAFTNPKGDKYLVSTKILGQKPDCVKNKFNDENLKNMVELLIELDTPRKNNKDNRFPYDVLMHYDLCGGNIVIDSTRAGIIDFEYLSCEDLNRQYQRGKDNSPTADFNYSDVACLPSNLRGFEYRTLYPYLLSISRDEASDLFDKYLKHKSFYHKKMSDFYKANRDTNNGEIFDELAYKESAHAKVLKNPDENVKKAEALKIQTARFMFVQSPFEIILSGVNVNQFHEYLNNALAFFKEKAGETNQDKNHQIYYKDGLKLLQKWQGLHGYMEYQAKEPGPITNSHMCNLIPDKQKEISRKIYNERSQWANGYKSDGFNGLIYDDKQKSVRSFYCGDYCVSYEELLDEYRKFGVFSNVIVDNITRDCLAEDMEKKHHELFQSKLTDKHIKTLDEHLGLA